MINFLKAELAEIRLFFKNYGRETIILVSATLFISLNRYHPIRNDWLSTFLYYGVFPLAVILLMRKNPLDFGLKPGSPRIWGYYVLIICLASAVVLFAAAYMPALQKYYRLGQFKFAPFFLTSCLSLAGSEFMYRGFLLFGLKDKFKEGSILLQMVPFVLLHLGKPEVETVSTLFTGILFGWVAYRGKSYWPAFFIHLFINVFFITLVNYKFHVIPPG